MLGRNDPCPCGSGKKYKKCCADSGRTANTSKPDLGLAINQFESGNYTAAVQTVKIFLKSNPTEPMAWQVLGVSLYYLGEFSVAEDAFRELIKRDKQNPDALNNLGLVLFEQNKLDEALSFCQQAIKLQPDMPGAHNNLGNIYRAMSEFNQAEKHYLAAIKSDIQTPEIYCNLGVVQQEKGDLSGAEVSYKKALSLVPQFVPALSNIGAMYIQQRNLFSALNNLEKAHANNPADSDVLCHLGSYWKEEGDYSKSEQYYQQALALKPNDSEVNFCVGCFYQTSGRYDKAEFYFKKALEDNPHYARSLAALGELYFDQSKRGLAERYFKKAIEIGGCYDAVILQGYCRYLLACSRYQQVLSIWQAIEKRYPKNPTIQLGLADYYEAIGDFDRTEEIYNKLVNEQKRDTGLLYKWAAMEEARHETEKAIALVRQILDIDHEHVMAHQLYARILLRENRYEKAYEEINKIELEKLDNDNYSCSIILFERAKIRDRLGEYDAAYGDLVTANNLKNKVVGFGYDQETRITYSDKLSDVFSQDNIKHLPYYEGVSTSDEATPIFIVGFPRSGTTLIEQILASHTIISAGGELPFIVEIKNKIKELTGSENAYPFSLLDPKKPLTQSDIKKLREHYLCRVSETDILKPGCSMVTDKMPHNLENLGLISLLFPEAPIIHIIRHPMDVCLSAYMANFEYGYGHRYTSSMENTVAEYSHLMALTEHYKSVQDMIYMQIRYEDILDDPEICVRGVLEFIGLPWEEACLKFYENKRVSKTASYAQVTQKLYTSSRYRYKNYYKHLEPYEPILREAMNRFGYTFRD